MQSRKQLGISRLGYIFYCLGMVNTTKMKVRLAHPLGLLWYVPIMLIAAFLMIFIDENIVEFHRDTWCLW